MGYYNDHYPPNPHRKKRQNWLVPILVGVIIGILLVVVAVPSILDSNIIPDKWATQQKSNEDGGKDGMSGSGKSINVDVSSQITEVVGEVSPAVVGVTNIQNQSDFWQQQGGTEAGSGSGVIYKEEDGDAYVVTNHHVIEGADTVEVVLFDDSHITADLVGSDLFSDLAVLKMDSKQVEKVIEMGSSDDVKVGEPAIAIGNPLGLMFSGSVTQGVISGKQRTIPQDFNQDGRADWQAEVIQTDAAINPGNSGGALINIEGQLIGINSMKINQAIAQGIGFAIPIDTAKPIIEELEETGTVTRPHLGVEIYSLEEIPKIEWENTLHLPESVHGGVYNWSIEPLTPADEAGLRRLDVITSFAGEEVDDVLALRKILYQEKQVGDEVEVIYYRDGEQMKTTVNLGEQE